MGGWQGGLVGSWDDGFVQRSRVRGSLRFPRAAAEGSRLVVLGGGCRDRCRKAAGKPRESYRRAAGKLPQGRGKAAGKEPSYSITK